MFSQVYGTVHISLATYIYKKKNQKQKCSKNRITVHCTIIILCIKKGTNNIIYNKLYCNHHTKEVDTAPKVINVEAKGSLRSM